MNKHEPNDIPRIPAAESQGTGDADPPKMIAFEALAEGHSEVLIEFHGQVYRLRCTRNKKLILNK
jgi:hemin uptake protein HemP